MRYGAAMAEGKADRTGAAGREDRLKQALKANLQRRKAQARARGAAAETGGAESSSSRHSATGPETGEGQE